MSQQVVGFLCVVAPKGNTKMRIMFGQGEGERQYGNFYGNGLKPYQTIEEAKIGQKQLSARPDFKSVVLAKISMEIFRGTEIETLHKKKNLAVLIFASVRIRIIGRWIKNTPSAYPLYGADIENNGFRPYRSFQEAFFSASEAQRQAGCSVALATFKFVRVPDI